METESKKKKMKLWQKLLIAFGILLVFMMVSGVVAGQMIMKSSAEKKTTHPGNAESYRVENISPLADSPLQGKNILFLGSSVTYGDASQGVSFADYIGKLDGVNVTKEAVSATTLVDENSTLAQLGYGDGRSYVTRLRENVDKNVHFDAVVVQLSTNDASTGKPLGELGSSMNIADFDAKTVTGAIETIIAYVRDTWGCPVIFYTGSYYQSEAYAAMVDRLLEIQEKWDIGVVDLYTDEDFNRIDESTYNLYMYDSIHPTKAGYLEWWTPAIEAYLYDYLR